MNRRRQIRASVSIRLGNATESFEASAEIDPDDDVDAELEKLFRTLHRQRVTVEHATAVQRIHYEGIDDNDD